MSWLAKVLTLGWVLASFAGCNLCDDGAEKRHDDVAINYLWRPEKEVKLHCAWLSQLSVSGERTKTCGHASLVMANACIDGYIPEYSEVLEVLKWMREYSPAYAYSEEKGTYLYELGDVAEDYYGLSAQSFEFGIGDVVTLKDMYEDLQLGLPILVGVMAKDTCMRYPSHFELLVGMTPTHVILNDPAPFDAVFGLNRQLTIKTFLGMWSGGVRFLPKRQ